LYLFAVQIIQNSTVVKKKFDSQNLPVKITHFGILNVQSRASIEIASKDDPPVIVVPPSKIQWNNMAA